MTMLPVLPLAPMVTLAVGAGSRDILLPDWIEGEVRTLEYTFPQGDPPSPHACTPAVLGTIWFAN